MKQQRTPERLGECLAAWMDEQGVSAAELAQMVGYKSKTSVLRLLKSQCNEQTMVSFVKSLSPYLNDEWIARFQKALRVEKNGLTNQMMFDAMDECMNGTSADHEICAESLLPSSGETAYVLGHPWTETFSIINGLLQKGFRVRHYIRANSFEKWVGKQGQPNYSEITDSHQASKPFPHNHSSWQHDWLSGGCCHL